MEAEAVLTATRAAPVASLGGKPCSGKDPEAFTRRTPFHIILRYGYLASHICFSYATDHSTFDFAIRNIPTAANMTLRGP